MAAMRRLAQVSFLLALVGVLLACNRPEIDPGAPKGVSLRLKWLVQVQSAGEIVADQAGHFEQHGLDVTIRPGGPDFDSIKLVASGENDYGVTSADQLLLAREKGVPIVAIAVLFHESPVVFFARSEDELERPEDFMGKTVGVKFGTNAETEYVVLLERAGIDRTQVEEVPVKFDMTPFFTGAVEVWPGIESNEPLVARRRGLDLDILRSRDFGVQTYSNVYFTTEKRLRENPEQVKGFVQALAAGWRQVARDPEAGVEHVLRVNEQLEREHELAGLKLTLPLVFPDGESSFGRMTTQGWEQTQSVLLDGDLMDRPTELSEAWVDVF